MTSIEEQADSHRDHLTALTAEGGPLTALGDYSTVKNPAWFLAGLAGRPQPRPERRDLHSRLVEDAEARHSEVRQDRQAIVLAGPPGAGKSTALTELIKATGTDPGHWRVINPDDFKDDLLEQALADGSYRQNLVPPEVAALEAAGERFYPRELASLVHHESGMIAGRARRRAIERGDNVAIDGTLSDERSAHQLVERLVEAGYQVRIAAVDAPRDVVEQRIVARWRTGYLAAESKTATSAQDAVLGGRWVPSGVPASLYPPGRPEQSVCTGIARSVAETHAAVRQIDLYQVNSPQAAPELVERRGRVGDSAGLLDQEAYDAMATTQATRSLREVAWPRPGAPTRRPPPEIGR